MKKLLTIILITTQITLKPLSYSQILKIYENSKNLKQTQNTSKASKKALIQKNITKNISTGKKILRKLNIKKHLDKNFLQEDVIKTLGGSLLVGGLASKYQNKKNISIAKKIFNDSVITHVRILESTESDINRLHLINKAIKRVVGKISNATDAMVFKMNIEIQKVYNKD